MVDVSGLDGIVVINVVFVAQSTFAQQTVFGWGLNAVCKPIHLGETTATGWPSHGSVWDRTLNLPSGEPAQTAQ